MRGKQRSRRPISFTNVRGTIESLEQRRMLTTLAGDFDGNVCRDFADLDQLSTAIIQGNTDATFDLNQDLRVDVADLRHWVKEFRWTSIGDTNLDGYFDSGDLSEVFAAGLFEQDREANWETGDWNADGRFDTRDIVAAFQDNGYEMGLRTPILESGQVFSAPLCGTRPDTTSFRINVTEPTLLYAPRPHYNTLVGEDEGVAIIVASSRVLTPSGDTLIPSSLGILINAEEAGIYTYILDYGGDFPVKAELQFTELPNVETVDLDSVVPATFASTNAVAYQFSGEAGERFFVNSERLPADVSTFVFDSDYELSTPMSSENQQFTAHELRSNEVHTVLFVEADRQTLDANFEFELITEKLDLRTIDLNTDVNGTIERKGEYDIVHFSGVEGQRLLFDQLRGELLGVGMLVAEDSDWRVNVPLLPVVTHLPPLPVDGDYKLYLNLRRIRSEADFQSYSFRLFDLAEATNFSLGDAIAVTLNPETRVGVYRFEANADDEIEFSINLAGRALRLTLLDSDGESVGDAIFASPDPARRRIATSGSITLVVELLDANDDADPLEFVIQSDLVIL